MWMPLPFLAVAVVLLALAGWVRRRRRTVVIKARSGTAGANGQDPRTACCFQASDDGTIMV
jgi:hypothetical protein